MKVQETWIFTKEEKKVILSLIAKGEEEQSKNEKFAIIDFNSFYSLFTKEETAIIKKYLAIDPAAVGYKLPFLGLEDIPHDIVSLANQSYVLDGKKCVISCQHLPTETFQAYEQMNQAMHNQINKKLLVNYGYRSPARQIFMFFDILTRIYDFDFGKTLRRVCFPAYSEHVCPNRQAIDFMTQDGIKGDDFHKTNEYAWLLKNARKFDFFESYPQNNSFGMMYEPWHWHHERQT